MRDAAGRAQRLVLNLSRADRDEGRSPRRAACAIIPFGMRRSLERATITTLLAVSVACHPFRGPVIGGTQQHVGGTIAGTVSATGGTVALASRTVTAINTATKVRYDT